MQEGKVLFIDDATLISPAVLAVAYPAMDGRREITVKAHKGEMIKAADGFYVIAGHNPGVHGAILTEALSSRFIGPGQGLHRLRPRPRPQDRPPRDQGRPDLAARQASGEIGWAPQLRELLAYAQGRRHPRRGRRHRQPGRHRPRGRPRRRRRGRSQSLRPQGGRPPRPRPPDLAPARRSRKGPPAMSATATRPPPPALARRPRRRLEERSPPP